MRFTILLITTFVIIITVYNQESPEVDFKQVTTGDANHVGEIIQKKGESVLIEERYTHFNQPLSLIWITINDETDIFTDQQEETTLTKLKKGDMVEVWNDGMILESYPAKTTALKIRRLPHK